MQSYCHQIALLDRTMSLYCLLDSSRLEGYFELERLLGCRMMNRGAYSGSCAVGLSGLIFGLIAIDNVVSGLQQRSIFGFFTVPAKVCPAALSLHKASPHGRKQNSLSSCPHNATALLCGLAPYLARKTPDDRAGAQESIPCPK